jgi:hypothetical protein
MKLHHKIKSWAVDYYHMVKGSVLMTIHKEPPKHYLDYVVEGKVPVVLIPGILGKWGFMKHLGDKISLAGHPVYIVPRLGYNVYSIPNSAKILEATVFHLFPALGHLIPRMHMEEQSNKEIIEKENIKNVVFVAHSKGGLIGKYFLAHFNKDRKVSGMVSIATPYSGSAMARLIPLDPIRELHIDSKIIHDLESHKEVNHQIVSIIPEYDNHVWAEKGSFLDGAENIEVPVHGHHKVLFSPEVCDVVLKSIEKLSKNN